MDNDHLKTPAHILEREQHDPTEEIDLSPVQPVYQEQRPKVEFLITERPAPKSEKKFTPYSFLYPPKHLFIGGKDFAGRYRKFLEIKHKELWDVLGNDAKAVLDHASGLHVSVRQTGKSTMAWRIDLLIETSLKEECQLFNQVHVTDRLVVLCRNKGELRHHEAIRDTLTTFLKEREDLLKELVYLFD